MSKASIAYEIEKYFALAGIPRGPKSKYYIVDPANGSANGDGQSFKKPLDSLEDAEDRCVANQNDVVLYVAGSSGFNLTAALTWDKSYTHLLGLCAPTRVAKRARIFQTSTLTGASPLLTISASGCIFKDFYIFQGVDDATSLINVAVTGGRNYFENVHFAGGGHATQAINGGASLKLDGAEENTFKNCVVGVDTIAAANGMVNLLFDGAAVRNEFEDCRFLLYAGNAGAAFVEIVDNAGIDRWNEFKNCSFLNTCRTYSLTSAFVIPASMNSVTNFLLLKDCMVLGATKLDANDRGVLYGNMNAVTGADLSGVAVELID